jgi:hypothetical protein
MRKSVYECDGCGVQATIPPTEGSGSPTFAHIEGWVELSRVRMDASTRVAAPVGTYCPNCMTRIEQALSPVLGPKPHRVLARRSPVRDPDARIEDAPESQLEKERS